METEMAYNWTTLWSNIASLFACDPSQPLMFHSGTFWCLFILFLPIYALLKRHSRAMMLAFVVAFSLLIGYKSSGWAILLLLFTTTTDWYLARRVVASTDPVKRKTLVSLSIVTSLLILGFFKYGNFVLLNWHAIVGGNFSPMDILTPLGISFYTFRSISYIVDVYKGKLKPDCTWLEYAFYLSFFPSLAAGPIARGVDFLPQVRANRVATRNEVYSGLWQVLLGVIKKAVLADYLAQYSALVFGLAAGEGVPLLVGAFAFTLQIYCDFAGYSDMAIGLGRIMGYNLGVNFDFPYRSRNVTEFWHRWHITLSTWLRDYVYIPLGGNRKGKTRQYLNLFATMLIGGLWHGAAWTFVVWGAMHGAALCIHKALMPKLKKIPDTPIVKILSGFITFIFVMVTFVVFRAESMHDCMTYLRDIFVNWDSSYFHTIVTQRSLMCVVMLVIVVTHFIPKRAYAWLECRFVAAPWIVKLVVFLAVVQLVLQFASAEVQPFIYNQF